MTSSNDFSRFVTCFGAVVGVGIVLAVALVVVVDPYRLYQLVDLPGFNQLKPSPERYQEQIKLTGARALRAKVLIAGNSRAEIGFDPEYRALAAGGASTYNIALAGTAISVSRRELDYLRGVALAPSKVVMGIDFLDFLLDPAHPPAVPKPGPAQSAFHWQFDSLFSITSVLDAIKTIRMQHADDAESLTARGFNPLREYRKHVRDDGYYPLFQQRASEYAKTFVRKPHGLLIAATDSSRGLDEFRAILANAAHDRTELHVVIYPYHAQIMAMFEQVGLDTVFAQWKGLLVREVEAMRKSYPDANITLWDFSGYSHYQCEVIPAKGDKTGSTQWYWEAGHFKPALGNLVLARVLAGADAPATADGLGVPLTSSTLAANEQRIAQERASCVATYPGLFRDARDKVERAMRAR